MPLGPLFGVPLGPELVVLFLVAVVFGGLVLAALGAARLLGRAGDDRVRELEERVDRLERELDRRE